MNNISLAQMQRLEFEPTTCHMINGPPFATGEPHYGHFLNLTLKDIILGINNFLGNDVRGTEIRYDVHGLPTELKVQKKIKDEYGYSDIHEILSKLGLQKYNEMCMEYLEKTMRMWPVSLRGLCTTIGFSEQSTMDFSYMNTLWYMFGELYKKGLIYEGMKVQPYSAEAETCISSFEAKQNYQTVNEKSIYVLFRFKNKFQDKDVSLIVWTTTPFTLFSNTALCINEKMEYQLFQHKGDWFIASKSFVAGLKDTKNIINVGAEQLKGLEYIPIYDYNPNRYYKIIWDTYVTEGTGTGIVHNSPSHGDDDHRVCLKFGIIDRCGNGCFDPTDSKMHFTCAVGPYIGREARSCNADIIKDIKSLGLLFKEEMISHELPHCWRTNTILYFKLVPTINLNVQMIKENILRNFETINFPHGAGQERMRETIINAPDWCLSRSRLWGTPIPLWKSEDGDILVISSAAELEELTGVEKGSITNLHTDKIPNIIVKNEKEYRACNYTMDCWFESGAQFMGETGYPYESKEIRIADFILEGMDQTRGWFYTLLVLGTALIDRSPYKNIIINGIVLDENGIKFSKSLENYRDIGLVINDYGVDAVRLHLMASPASKGINFKYIEQHIREWNKNMTIPLKNTLALFTEYFNLYKTQHGGFEYIVSDNDIDIWIMSQLKNFIKNIITHVTEYKLYKLGDFIADFIQTMNNGYCKFNRNAIKSKCSKDTWQKCLSTLGYVLHSLSVVLYIITPNIANEIFTRLVEISFVTDGKAIGEYKITDIVFIEDSPKTTEATAVIDIVFKQIYSVLTYRANHTIGCKRPFAKVIFGLQHNDMCYLDRIKQYTELIEVEANVFEIDYIDIDTYMEKRVKPNFKTIGTEFKRDMKRITDHLKNDANNRRAGMGIDVEGIYEFDDFRLSERHLELVNWFKPMDGFKTETCNGITIYINDVESEEVIDTYLARYFASRIQQYRKEIGIRVVDNIDIRYVACNELQKVFDNKTEYIEKILDKSLKPLVDDKEYMDNLFAKPGEFEKDGLSITVYLRKLD